MSRFANRNLIETLLFFVALALAWEFGVRAFEVRSYLLPAPSQILAEFWSSRARSPNTRG